MKTLVSSSVYGRISAIYFHVLRCHFLTKNMCSVFYPVYGTMCDMQFLILGINYDYNNGMYDVDLS